MLKDFQITKEQQEDIGEMTNILILLPVPDREILMSNAKGVKSQGRACKEIGVRGAKSRIGGMQGNE